MYYDHIEVRNKEVVQFLYMHGIDFELMDMTGKTIWIYPDTQAVRKIIDEYFTGLAHRHELKKI